MGILRLGKSHLPKQLANCFGYLILSGEKYLCVCHRWVDACPEYLKVILCFGHFCFRSSLYSLQ